MSFRTIGPIYRYQTTNLFAEDRLDAFVEASRRHPGGFEFGGLRFRVVEERDVPRLRDAYTVVAPGGGVAHVQQLPPPVASETASKTPPTVPREAAAEAAERRARAWDDRVKRKRAKH